MSSKHTGRVLYFVRHGQYHTGDGPKAGTLTALGRRQARRIAHYFREIPVNSVISSNMPRAVETAAILAEELGLVHNKRLPLLREVMPAKVKGLVVPLSKRKEARARIDQIYEQFFVPTRGTRHEIVVCHGNLIRALVCRVIGAPPIAFQKPMTHNGSVTCFVVIEGREMLASFNSISHLPAALHTMM